MVRRIGHFGPVRDGIVGNAERVRCAAKKNQTFLVFTEGSLRVRVIAGRHFEFRNMDKRSQTDRRKKPTPILSRYTFFAAGEVLSGVGRIAFAAAM
jgi:hypothetical protein